MAKVRFLQARHAGPTAHRMRGSASQVLRECRYVHMYIRTSGTSRAVAAGLVRAKPYTGGSGHCFCAWKARRRRVFIWAVNTPKQDNLPVVMARVAVVEGALADRSCVPGSRTICVRAN